jgi:hypothetical protein
MHGIASHFVYTLVIIQCNNVTQTVAKRAVYEERKENKLTVTMKSELQAYEAEKLGCLVGRSGGRWTRFFMPEHLSGAWRTKTWICIVCRANLVSAASVKA